MTVNLFVLSTGFQYYFSTLLIEHLGLADVAYAMYQPREGIERRAAVAHPVVFAARGLDTHFTSILGSPTSKRDNMRLLAESGAIRGRALYFGDAELDMHLAEEFGLEFVFVHGVSDWPDGRAHCPHRQIGDFTELALHDASPGIASMEDSST